MPVESDLAKVKDALNQANSAATQSKSERDKLQSTADNTQVRSRRL